MNRNRSRPAGDVAADDILLACSNRHWAATQVWASRQSRGASHGLAVGAPDGLVLVASARGDSLCRDGGSTCVVGRARGGGATWRPALRQNGSGNVRRASHIGRFSAPGATTAKPGLGCGSPGKLAIGDYWRLAFRNVRSRDRVDSRLPRISSAAPRGRSSGRGLGAPMGRFVRWARHSGKHSVSGHKGCWPAALPYAAGLCLVVPAVLWQRLTPTERLCILQHELAHWERRDLIKSTMVRLLTLPHWFNPLSWLAAGWFDEAAEWACDEVAKGANCKGAASMPKHCSNWTPSSDRAYRIMPPPQAAAFPFAFNVYSIPKRKRIRS